MGLAANGRCMSVVKINTRGKEEGVVQVYDYYDDKKEWQPVGDSIVLAPASGKVLVATAPPSADDGVQHACLFGMSLLHSAH